MYLENRIQERIKKIKTSEVIVIKGIIITEIEENDRKKLT